jgi:ankyrin repeat protein
MGNKQGPASSASGAEAESSPDEYTVPAGGFPSVPVLHCAAHADVGTLSKLLDSKNVAIDEGDPIDGRTALMWAVSSRQLDNAKHLLVRRGASHSVLDAVSVHASTWFVLMARLQSKRSALMYACMASQDRKKPDCQVELVALLLAHGADPALNVSSPCPRLLSYAPLPSARSCVPQSGTTALILAASDDRNVPAATRLLSSGEGW